MPNRTQTQGTAKGQRDRLVWAKSMMQITGISAFPRDEWSSLWLVGETLGAMARSPDSLSKVAELLPGGIVPRRWRHWSQAAPDSRLLP
ncbi:MAG TPA: hypothetical protein VEI01_03995 [Terriglobales bacterium]|nr:hypothetical protein [Terriglobales bacterium]